MITRFLGNLALGSGVALSLLSAGLAGCTQTAQTAAAPRRTVYVSRHSITGSHIPQPDNVRSTEVETESVSPETRLPVTGVKGGN